MILVNVEDYCQSCLDFTPDVTPPQRVRVPDDREFTMGDTIIKCVYRKRCAAIKRYLENQMKEELANDL